MKRNAFLCLMIFVLALASVGSLAAQAVPMPNYVLHAAQTLNAQYGANIDVNNVIWEFLDFGVDLAGATSKCPQVAQSAPAVGSNHVYLVEFQPVRNGLWGEEIWEAVVFGDSSFVGLCTAPLPDVIPSPGVILPTVTPSNCGIMPSRLLIGQEARVAGTVPNNLRSQPFVSGSYVGEIPSQAIFLVLDGPRCSAEGAWWYVNYNGTAGWTLEGQSGEYYLEPLNIVTGQATLAPTVAPFVPVATPIVCNPAMPSRLVVGTSARVTPGIPNNVRANAGSSGQLLGEIPAGGIFRVLAGPTCASGVAWWQVDYNGLVGWTGEGMDGDYWLEPAYAIFAPLNPENLATSTRLANFELSNTDTLQFNNADMLFVKNANSIGLVNAVDPFAALNTLTWNANELYNSPQVLIGMQVIGNEVGWIATLENGAASLKQRQADGTYLERYLVSDLGVRKVLFSPDARYAMLVDASEAIQVFDTTIGQILAVLPTTELHDPVNQMVFSPDGRVFAAGYSTGFTVWQVNNWAVLGSSFFDSPQSVHAIALNNTDFAFAVASSQDAMAFVVPIEYLASWANWGGVRHSSAALALALAPDRSALLIATAEGLEYSPLPEDEILFATSLDAELSGTVRQMSISPDGRLLAIATENHIELWAAPES